MEGACGVRSCRRFHLEWISSEPPVQHGELNPVSGIDPVCLLTQGCGDRGGLAGLPAWSTGLGASPGPGRRSRTASEVTAGRQICARPVFFLEIK